jgi:MAF protein
VGTERKIVLASASPRRRQLLTQLGVPFSARASDVNEDPLPGESPSDTQQRITRAKAEAIAADLRVGAGEWVVIASDTTVLLDDEMLNKPADAAEAWSMLRRLRGRAHVVQSCLVVLEGGAGQEERCSIELLRSDVQMRAYDDEEIAAYIASGDPFDKAGSYAVQHPVFRPVEEIRGCPLNVIGLSLCRLRRHLPMLPDSSPVCNAWFGRSCAEAQP